MNTRLKIDKSAYGQLRYVLTLPSFFLLFSMLYNPFGIKGYYVFGIYGKGFHLVMLTAILLLTLFITRVILYFVLQKKEMLWRQYTVWCFGETFLAAGFMALYTSLFSPETAYFDALGYCCKFMLLTLAYPYIFLVMWQIIENKNEQIRMKEQNVEETLFKFYDEHKRLKFSIEPSAILYINSEFNYIRIHYLEADEVKEFTLRNSMKNIEAATVRQGLIRCQRSYIVNPKRVKVLRKDKDGFIFAELNIAGMKPIPVSKQYYSALSELL